MFFTFIIPTHSLTHSLTLLLTTLTHPLHRHTTRSSMSTKAKKYIFVGGVMKANPDYVKGDGDSPAPSPSASSSSSASLGGKKPEAPLAVVCSMADIESATKLQAVTTGAPMQISQKTSETIMNMQEEEFLGAFHTPAGVQLDGGEIIDKLSEYFIQYEVCALGCRRID
jgi:hypothetical protein